MRQSCKRGLFRTKGPGAAALVLATLIALPLPEASALFGRSGNTRDYERKVGREFEAMAEKALPFIDDDEVFAYLNEAGQSIARNVHPRAFDYRFHVVKSDDVNAFAVPGGYIYFFAGLISTIDSEEELLGVIAHEISHVEAHHFIQNQKRSKKTLVASIAAILLAALFSPENLGAVAVTTQAADATINLKFSRDQERESDRMGLGYLKNAGVNPRGMLDIFTKFAEMQKLNLGDIPPYFLTHPTGLERVDDIRMLFISEEPPPIVVPPMDPLKKIQAITRIKTDPTSVWIDQYREKAAAAPEDLEARYLLGIALLHKGLLEEAALEIEATLVIDPGRASMQIELAEILMRLDRFDEAGQWLDSAEAIEPGTTALLAARAELALGRERFEESIDLYNQALALDHENPSIHRGLGNVCGRADRLGPAYYHLGMASRLRWEDGRARDYFSRAIKHLDQEDLLRSKAKAELDRIEKEKPERGVHDFDEQDRLRPGPGGVSFYGDSAG